jgi:hypothetical protein
VKADFSKNEFGCKGFIVINKYFYLTIWRFNIVLFGSEERFCFIIPPGCLEDSTEKSKG